MHWAWAVALKPFDADAASHLHVKSPASHYFRSQSYSFMWLAPFSNHDWEGSGTLLTQTLPKACVWQGEPDSCCVPIFQSLASTVAKIGRGSQLFWMLPWPRPRQFWSKTLFSGKLVPNPICVPNLKLLVLTVAEIRRGSQFFLAAPLAQTPANYGPKRCFFW